MKLPYIKCFVTIFAFVTLLCMSCQDEFLAKKPDKSLLVPTKLEDFDAILDGVMIMNYNYASISHIASDDFYITDNGFSVLDAIEQGAYLWEETVFNGLTMVYDWDFLYSKIFHANIVLDGLKEVEVTGSSQRDYDRIKGSALFYRAYNLYELAQTFADPYLNEETDGGKQGLYVRLESNVNTVVDRSSLRETYSQILEDLSEAEALLPLTSQFITRPNKLAAWALLARIYLGMADYDNASYYAGRCLETKGELLDYNSIDTTLTIPFPHALTEPNEELILYSTLGNYSFFSSPLVGIDSALYNTYVEGDLRKRFFFTTRGENLHSFTGSYTGGDGLAFSGFAVDEVLLIRAECFAREGNVSLALNDLNYLLSHRIATDKFEPIETSDAQQALDTILLERRKELISRGLRWTDLRRLNEESGRGITLVRIVNGTRYELLPTSARYTFPFPDYEH